MFVHISKQKCRTVPTRKLLHYTSQTLSPYTSQLPMTNPYQSKQNNAGDWQLHRRFETSEVRLGIKVNGGTYTPTPSTKGPQQRKSPGPEGKLEMERVTMERQMLNTIILNNKW